MKKEILLLYLLFVGNILIAQKKETGSIAKIKNLELPASLPHEEIIHHTYYTLSYNETHEQANWVAYELTSDETKAVYSRSNKFMTDPLVSTKTANDTDYKNSGYDRGHLAPAGDMVWSDIAMKESFYYSNMSPQEPGFNRGIWKKLEGQVRSWAIEYHSIYIVTGPVLTDHLKTIGYNKVSVPEYYYKVILNYSDSTTIGIGFIMPNKSSNEALQQFAVSIDSIEAITNIDFFPALPNKIENEIESKVSISLWIWGNENLPVENKNISAVTKTTLMQCSAITSSGKRCKRKTSNLSDKCWQHRKN